MPGRPRVSGAIPGAARPLPAWFHERSRVSAVSSGGFFTLPADLVAIPAEFAACTLLNLFRSAARALHRAYRVRDAASVASLLGAPTPAALESAWRAVPRTLPRVLLLGARLSDLAATHPGGLLRTPDAHARCVISGRNPGLKGYLASTHPGIPYSTAIHYKKLAQRTAAALKLPPGLPLDWLLTDARPSSLTDDPALLAAIPPARRALSRLLAKHPSQRALARAVEKALGIERLSLRADLAVTNPRDAAARDALLARYERRLAAAAACGRPITRPEKRAVALLAALRKAMAPPG